MIKNINKDMEYEIRKLAYKSKKSSDSINKLIENISMGKNSVVVTNNDVNLDRKKHIEFIENSIENLIKIIVEIDEIIKV